MHLYPVGPHVEGQPLLLPHPLQEGQVLVGQQLLPGGGGVGGEKVEGEEKGDEVEGEDVEEKGEE